MGKLLAVVCFRVNHAALINVKHCMSLFVSLFVSGDLQQRGLLENTLVVWCTEFGRMPTFQKGASGRDHNPSGFTTWLAGAGAKRAFSNGATDDFGYKAVENVATVYDFHATILHLLGLDHERKNKGVGYRIGILDKFSWPFSWACRSCLSSNNGPLHL